jgi:hypothetical protein
MKMLEIITEVSKIEVVQLDEGVGQFSVKKRKSTVLPGSDKDFIPDVEEIEYDIVHNGKVVGNLKTDDYLGYIHGSLYGKDLPELSNYGTHTGSGISSTLHTFLKSKTGQRWATTGKLRGKNILESVEQIEESYDDDEAFFETYGWLEDNLEEAEYQGRKVKLNKPMQGTSKKFKVYVKDPKTGNVKVVHFGHGGSSVKGKAMRIRKNNPKARKSFRARHNCDNPGSKLKARYWSCKAW